MKKKVTLVNSFLIMDPKEALDYLKSAMKAMKKERLGSLSLLRNFKLLSDNEHILRNVPLKSSYPYDLELEREKLISEFRDIYDDLFMIFKEERGWKSEEQLNSNEKDQIKDSIWNTLCKNEISESLSEKICKVFAEKDLKFDIFGI